MDDDKKKENNKFFVDGKMYFHNYTIPRTPKSEVFTKTSSKRRQTNIIIAVVGVLSILIMVLSKLKPIFITSWAQDICVRWNDFWFTLSASFTSAIFFYLCINYIPFIIKKEKINLS